MPGAADLNRIFYFCLSGDIVNLPSSSGPAALLRVRTRSAHRLHRLRSELGAVARAAQSPHRQGSIRPRAFWRAYGEWTAQTVLDGAACDSQLRANVDWQSTSAHRSIALHPAARPAVEGAFRAVSNRRI